MGAPLFLMLVCLRLRILPENSFGCVRFEELFVCPRPTGGEHRKLSMLFGQSHSFEVLDKAAPPYYNLSYIT